MLSAKTEGCPATSPAAVAGIEEHDDLLAEILRRLPLKSLDRAKSVSKQWLSLITSPSFSRLRNPNPNLPSGIFFSQYSRPPRGYQDHMNSEFVRKIFYVPLNKNKAVSDPSTALAFFNENPYLSILQSCNGLLCCRDKLISEYFIVNPTTKQFTKIHFPPQCYGVCLAFDPSKSPHYKLIYVFRDYNDYSCQIKILSSETLRWAFSKRFTAPIRMKFSRGFFWNGAIHWISENGDSLYFKVDEQTLHTLPMPPVPQGTRPECWKVGDCGGHFHLFHFYTASLYVEFKIYELEKDYSGWFVKYSVDLCTCIDPLFFCILGIVRSENDDESVLVLHRPEDVISYNLKDGTVEKILDMDDSLEEMEGMDKDYIGRTKKKDYLVKFGSFHAYPYFESLVSID